MLGEDVLYKSIRELSHLIRSREISPVELAESYLERSRRLGPKLNAYALLTEELALAEARRAEREITSGRWRGPLHGIPYAAKDLLSVSGYPTGWGAKPFANQVFNYTATVINKLRRAGAVLIGKAAMIELAGGMGYRFASASASGPARNPWNQSCWTCGSSSGSGAAVAAALAAFAIGSETWGSIICPSAFCGITGLRPTYGRVSRYGAMALSFSMDKLGPMCRSAEDCGIVLEHIAGYDRRDPSSLHGAAFKLGPVQRRLRIGLISNAWKSLSSDIESAVRAAASALERGGARLQEAKLPEGPWDAVAAIVIAAEGASAFDSLIDSGRVAELADPLGKVACYANSYVRAADYIRAMRIRAVLQKKIDELFEKFDVLMAASLPMTATALDANLEQAFDISDPAGSIGNLCGLPAMSVPCGFDHRGLPIGIQFIGRAMDDHKVIAAARLFQEVTDWHRRRPPIHLEGQLRRKLDLSRVEARGES
jgi:aspartyl-tRNA(Asn)/glutamyl-tRNA(Gln) amidotransferase subunit A